MRVGTLLPASGYMQEHPYKVLIYLQTSQYRNLAAKMNSEVKEVIVHNHHHQTKVDRYASARMVFFFCAGVAYIRVNYLLNNLLQGSSPRRMAKTMSM